MIIKEKTKLETEDEFVKVVVDIERSVLSAHCLMHADCAEELVADGSEWKNLWGANVFPSDGHIQFSSLINIRPKAGNKSMEITIPSVQTQIFEIIKKLTC